MSEVFSVLLHNRQRYEQGKEGLWFSLPTTTEKLQAALREIGISADNPQDFFLYDYRSPQARPIKLPRDMVLSAGMDELNFLAARLEKLDAAELMELNAALTSPQSDFHNIGQIIDYPENVDFYVHLPDVTGTGQLGDYYLNRSGMVDMPEEWKAGILLPRAGTIPGDGLSRAEISAGGKQGAAGGGSAYKDPAACHPYSLKRPEQRRAHERDHRPAGNRHTGAFRE